MFEAITEATRKADQTIYEKINAIILTEGEWRGEGKTPQDITRRYMETFAQKAQEFGDHWTSEELAEVASSMFKVEYNEALAIAQEVAKQTPPPALKTEETPEEEEEDIEISMEHEAQKIFASLVGDSATEKRLNEANTFSNSIPQKSIWAEFAQAFDVGMVDLDSFAQYMGYRNFRDLNSSRSPRSLYHKNPPKFIEAIKQSSLKAQDMSDEEIANITLKSRYTESKLNEKEIEEIEEIDKAKDAVDAIATIVDMFWSGGEGAGFWGEKKKEIVQTTIKYAVKKFGAEAIQQEFLSLVKEGEGWEVDDIKLVSKALGIKASLFLDESKLNEEEADDESISTRDHKHWYQYGKLYFTGSYHDLKKKMTQDRYWPNVFFVSDHGNAHLVTDESILNEGKWEEENPELNKSRLDAIEQYNKKMKDWQALAKKLGKELWEVDDPADEASYEVDDWAGDAEDVINKIDISLVDKEPGDDLDDQLWKYTMRRFIGSALEKYSKEELAKEIVPFLNQDHWTKEVIEFIEKMLDTKINASNITDESINETVIESYKCKTCDRIFSVGRGEEADVQAISWNGCCPDCDSSNLESVGRADESKLNEMNKTQVIELLKQGKIIYGVVEDDSTDWLVGKIDNLEEYVKNGYWDIENKYLTEEDAVEAAEKLANSEENERGVFIGVVNESTDSPAKKTEIDQPALDNKDYDPAEDIAAIAVGLAPVDFKAKPNDKEPSTMIPVQDEEIKDTFESIFERVNGIVEGGLSSIDKRSVLLEEELEEIPVSRDIYGKDIKKNDRVIFDEGRGVITAIWNDGTVDIEYAAGPGGPLVDTFDIKGHEVQKDEDIEEMCGKKHSKKKKKTNERKETLQDLEKQKAELKQDLKAAKRMCQRIAASGSGGWDQAKDEEGDIVDQLAEVEKKIELMKKKNESKSALYICNACAKTFESTTATCIHCKSTDVNSIREEADLSKLESSFEQQLAMGVEVEKEHTDDPEIAKKIAMDHLAEDPQYYTKLKKMEAGECDESKLNEEEKEQFKTIAQGIEDKADADELARKKQGQVVKDSTDEKKFAVIVKANKNG